MEGSGVDAAEAHPSGVRDNHSEVDDGPKKVNGDSVRYSLAWWLSFAIPISIALVAIMGAVVGWRAENHASLASEWETDAQVSSTYASGHVYDALLAGALAESDHDLWEGLAGADGNGTGQPMASEAEPACANANSSADSLPAAELAVDCQLAQVFSKYALPGYWEKGNPSEFATERYVADWTALSNLGRDVAVAQHEATANDERHRELRLLWLALLLAVALAFCTMAQAAVHHRWWKGSIVAALLLAIPGWILLIGCGAVLVAWEL